MISRQHLTTLLGLTAILWGALLLIGGMHPALSLAGPFPTVVGVLSILLGLFDKWLWRIPWLHPWFVSTPNVRGTWQGEIIPSGMDLETDQPYRSIRGYLVIRQTYSSISIRLITQESSSELLAGSIAESIDKLYTIFGTYRNTPRLKRRDESPIHYGGLFLDVRGVPADSLDGQYWTDRSTRGELHFHKRDKAIIQSFEQANDLIPS